jgi:hypothetical protein
MLNDQTREVVEFGVDDLYELLAHLVTSAEICTFEPWFYGTFRLIDAAARLSGRAVDRGLDDAWLRQFHDELDAKKKWMMSDRPAYFRFLEGASQKMAERLRERGKGALVARLEDRPVSEEPRT